MKETRLNRFMSMKLRPRLLYFNEFAYHAQNGGAFSDSAKGIVSFHRWRLPGKSVNLTPGCGKPIMKNLLWGAFMGAMFPTLIWRRRKEVDSYGNLCVRYFLLRFAMPLLVLFWMAVGVQNRDNPMYWEHPENFFFLGFFLLFTALASIHFCFYKISIKNNVIERLQGPLQPLQYNVKDLTFVGKKGNQHVLHFHGDRSLAIPVLLSGQTEFIGEAQKLILSRPGQRPFRRHGTRKQGTKRGRAQ